MACFLASHGLRGLMISAAASTADTPRAHITNMAALECLRDIGLEDECIRAGNKGSCMRHTRWCYSMAGREFARGDYELASPCEPLDLPQTLLEPILIQYATANGVEARFNTSFVSFETDQAGWFTCSVHDRTLDYTYSIRSKYLFGADGARSKLVAQLGLPLLRKPSKGTAINVLVRADLSKLIGTRMGNLHWVLQPDRPHPLFGWLGIARMVKPWHEWIFILFPRQDRSTAEASHDDYLRHIRGLIGDDSISVTILGVSSWVVNETVAEKYSRGNAFCLGDAVHRHPPMNGLGSNTCIQDAYNLAWKVAYVEKGFASPSLLETYSTERQPVGASVVACANRSFDLQDDVWGAMGILTLEPTACRAAMEELRAPTADGNARRKALRAALEATSHEFHALGAEMGQHYDNSAACASEETAVDPRDDCCSVLDYHPSTAPGRRLPHAWINASVPDRQPISTQDLAGGQSFCLLTGIGGQAWLRAAAMVAAETGVPLNAYPIGYMQDWEDVYHEWARVRGVEESGCVLVRPDRFVAWRCQGVLDSETECVDVLRGVLRRILGRDEPYLAADVRSFANV
ncbi:hypothetical protein CDD83_3691 [Cordyceps sp. RAO-2017]|nr:hypothetical protein CDD83_3691 [Cordyceps sp. RAO-2017]